MQQWEINQLCFEVDVEPYAKRRDVAISQLATAAGVSVSSHVSHTLYVSMSKRKKGVVKWSPDSNQAHILCCTLLKLYETIAQRAAASTGPVHSSHAACSHV